MRTRSRKAYAAGSGSGGGGGGGGGAAAGRGRRRAPRAPAQQGHSGQATQSQPDALDAPSPQRSRRTRSRNQQTEEANSRRRSAQVTRKRSLANARRTSENLEQSVVSSQRTRTKSSSPKKITPPEVRRNVSARKRKQSGVAKDAFACSPKVGRTEMSRVSRSTIGRRLSRGNSDDVSESEYQPSCQSESDHDSDSMEVEDLDEIDVSAIQGKDARPEKPKDIDVVMEPAVNDDSDRSQSNASELDSDESEPEVIVRRDTRSRRTLRRDRIESADSEAHHTPKKIRSLKNMEWSDSFYRNLRIVAEKSTSADGSSKTESIPVNSDVPFSIGDGHIPTLQDASDFVQMKCMSLREAVKKACALQGMTLTSLSHNFNFNNGNMSATLTGKFKSPMMTRTLALWCYESKRLGLKNANPLRVTHRRRGPQKRIRSSFKLDHELKAECGNVTAEQISALKQLDCRKNHIQKLTQYELSKHVCKGFEKVRVSVCPSATDNICEVSAFKSTCVQTGRNRPEAVLNVGGPVCCVTWCPVGSLKSNPEDCRQYLAVCAFSDGAFHLLSHKTSGDHIIQIWEFDADASTNPILRLVAVHNGGTVYQARWCPRPAWQSSSVQTADENFLRLGLLACVCGDGSLRVFSIPHPSSISVTSSADTGVIRIQSVLHYNINATCLAWATYKDSILLLAGSMDGSVFVFDTAESLSTVPSHIIRASEDGSAIRHICWSPETSMFAVSTQNGFVSLFDMRWSFLPVFSTQFSRGPVLCIEFVDTFGSIMASTEHGTRIIQQKNTSRIPHMLKDTVKMFVPAKSIEVLQQHGARILSFAFNDGSSLCCACIANERSYPEAFQIISKYSKQSANGDSSFCGCFESETNGPRLLCLDGPDKHVVKLVGEKRDRSYTPARDFVPESHWLKCDRLACSSVSVNANVLSRPTWFASGLSSGVVRCHLIDLGAFVASVL